MENSSFSSILSPKRLPSPRRGQIKIKIFKSVASVVGGFIRKPNQGRGSTVLASNPQTPAEPMSGYCSDALSETSLTAPDSMNLGFL